MITVNGKSDKVTDNVVKLIENKSSEFFVSGGSSGFHSADFSLSEDSVKIKEVVDLGQKVVREEEDLEQSSTKTISESFPDSIFDLEENEFSSEVSILANSPNNTNFYLQEKNVQIHKFLMMPSQNTPSKQSVRACPRLCTSSCILF